MRLALEKTGAGFHWPLFLKQNMQSNSEYFLQQREWDFKIQSDKAKREAIIKLLINRNFIIDRNFITTKKEICKPQNLSKK